MIPGSFKVAIIITGDITLPVTSTIAIDAKIDIVNAQASLIARNLDTRSQSVFDLPNQETLPRDLDTRTLIV